MLINPYVFGGYDYDANAQAYITAVETADGQALEIGVKNAINAFVVGCKADDIWTAIKASCILAGARTLAGALVPLLGTAPTNVNFVSGDYNRKTGLVGNASTKYLNSNRANDADPQNSYHQSVYATSTPSNAVRFYIGGQGSNANCVNDIYTDGANGLKFRNRGDSNMPFGSPSVTTGLLAHMRNSSSGFTYRAAGANVSRSKISEAFGSSQNIYVFARNQNGTASQFGDARLAFYSIGESLNLALLDSRVTTLINALAAAIP